MFAQLLGKMKTEGNGINQGGSCPWKKNRESLVRKIPSKYGLTNERERIIFSSDFHRAVVTGLPFQATIEFDELFDSAEREH